MKELSTTDELSARVLALRMIVARLISVVTHIQEHTGGGDRREIVRAAHEGVSDDFAKFPFIGFEREREELLRARVQHELDQIFIEMRPRPPKG